MVIVNRAVIFWRLTGNLTVG